MYLHCDYHASHYLKIAMDKIFEPKNFRNEIIWHYRRWTATAKRFQKLHDTIFFYTKTDRYNFNVLLTSYTEGSVERKKQGVLHRFKAGEKPVLVSDREVQKEGVPENDVWHIPFVAPSAKERIGYPTQKPEKLLERIVSASSNTRDVVLDPFCGCGTAIAVAHKLGRRWIGIDVSPTACKVMVKRMKSLGVEIQDRDIIGLPRSLEEVKAMQPFEFQNWVLQKLGGRVSERKSVDGGIDGWVYDKPVQVKQSDGVGRDVVKKLETAMRRFKKNGSIVVGFSFARTTYEEVARAKNEEGLSITLMTVEDLLSIP